MATVLSIIANNLLGQLLKHSSSRSSYSLLILPRPRISGVISRLLNKGITHVTGTNWNYRLPLQTETIGTNGNYRYKRKLPVQTETTGTNWNYRYKLKLPVQTETTGTGTNGNYRYKLKLPVQSSETLQPPAILAMNDTEQNQKKFGEKNTSCLLHTYRYKYLHCYPAQINQ